MRSSGSKSDVEASSSSQGLLSVEKQHQINAEVFQHSSICEPRKYGGSILIRLPFMPSFTVIGPHWPGIVVTIGVILGGAMVNLRLMHKSSVLSLTAKTDLTHFIYFMAFLTTTLLLCTALTNPGIVFHAKFRQFQSFAAQRRSQQDTSLSELETWNLQNLPYCQKCKILTPTEMKIIHCTDCGYCIESMDHHCPWMGQCIGKHNMA